MYRAPSQLYRTDACPSCSDDYLRRHSPVLDREPGDGGGPAQLPLFKSNIRQRRIPHATEGADPL